MKKKLLLLSAITFGIASVSLKSGGGGIHVASTGAPASSTGATGETTCAKSGCHDDNTVNNSLSTSSIAFGSGEQAYIPGNTYPITVSINNSSIQRFGYEIVALQDNDDMNAGSISITDPVRTQIVTNELEFQDREYVTYTFNGTDPYSPGTGQWTFNWNAPEEGSGPVTFYLATVAANNDGTDDGDYVYTKTFTINEVPVGIEKNQAAALRVFPSPASDVVNITGLESEENIGLYNLQGSLVKQWPANNTNSIVLNVADIPNGSYFLLLEKSNSVNKLVINR